MKNRDILPLVFLHKCIHLLPDRFLGVVLLHVRGQLGHQTPGPLFVLKLPFEVEHGLELGRKERGQPVLPDKIEVAKER